MIKEQAIEWLKSLNYCNGEETQEVAQAIEMGIKALEQQSSDDVMAIHTQGLNEGIRCAMCTNSMKSDSGCDGGCAIDEEMYKKVMDTIKNHIFDQPTSDDCVSRQAVLDEAYAYGNGLEPDGYCVNVEDIQALPPVTPTFPKGATNGDVIKAMFPNIEVDEIKTNTSGYIEVKYLDTTDKCDSTAFRKNWWNAPYTEKRGELNGSN